LNPWSVANDASDGQDAELSIAGGGSRTNDILVDGASYNDDFGLNASGYPGQASPINLDSIEQLNVRVAPSSIEYSNFEGGVIEIVTKGGT
jgi:outer membrane cobalamin receptor